MSPRVKVLLADDSAVVRVSVARRVRAVGLDVVEHESAAAAAGVDPSEVSCALLDLDLGDGSGTEIAARLRAARPTLPIAFFSSTTSVDVLAHARTYGPVFTKPDDLDAAVDWVTGHAAGSATSDQTG